MDRGRLDEVFARHAPEMVIHFAAHAYVGESIVDPAKYYRNNVAGSLTLLEAMLANGVKRIVFSSSCAIYGIPAAVPIDEGTPLTPINPYGMTKLVVERMLADFQRSHDVEWIALRYFNAAGDDPERETGENHDPETRLVPLVIEAAMRQDRQFMILGTDYDTPDGTCVRDFIHVCDLANAHVKAVEALSRGVASGPVNLGTGKGYSVREVIRAVERATGKSVPLSNGPRRRGDPAILVADAQKAREMLGWLPAMSDLHMIVDTAWKWAETKHVP